MLLHILSGHLLRQYAVVIILNLTVFGVGLGLAWPSPMLVKLRNSTETVLVEPITEEEGSWIVSIGFLVGSLTYFVPAFFLDRIGRKYTMLISTIPKVAAGLLLTFATRVWMLILGRMLSGIAVTYIFIVVPMYASEISSKEVRGSLGTILQIMCSLGIVIMLSVGPFVSYLSANILYTVVAAIGLSSIMLLPESPYFLHAKGRDDECLKVLTYLRGGEDAAKEEIKGYTAEATDSDSKVNKWRLFRSRLFLKSFGLNTVLAIGTQLIGFNAVTFYLQTVLESTHTSVRPEMASVIIGLIQLTASVCTTVVTDRFGRKPILAVSLVGMMIGMIGLGVFFFVKDGSGSISGFMNFLPLFSLILVVFCYSAGPGSLIWALSAELFDNSGRAVGLSLCSLTSGVSLFITTKYFPSIMVLISPAITYWVFSFNCLLLCTFIVVCLPETKGKSFAEIQEALGCRRQVDEEKPTN